MGSKKKILIIQKVHEKGMELINNHPNYDVEVTEDTSIENLKSKLKDCDGASIRIAKLPGETFEEAKNLKIISRHGVGYDNIDLKFELKKPIINILNGEETKYIISSEESTLSDNNKLLKLKGNVKLKTLKKDGNFLYADNFTWNIENTNYLLEGNIRFENQNIILNSGKAILGSDNIIEFFNPVKYIIKDDKNENKYEINSENAFYNLNYESVSFEAKDRRVKSIIYF